MRGGAEIIVQGAFQSDIWVGRTDVLRRISTPSKLGPWSYEVIDAKLARETKGGTVLQLCLYAELVAGVQGVRPENCYVVTPHSDYEPQVYRIADYGAYFRRIRDGLTSAVDRTEIEETYPEPCEHCDLCRWKEQCDLRRSTDDHLSLVAGATKVQIEELRRHDIDTAASLAAMPLPLATGPVTGRGSSRREAGVRVAARSSWLRTCLPSRTVSGRRIL
jgi:uncharacterized protein